MRQLGDLLVWCIVVAVVAGVIYFTPHIIQQVSNTGSLTFAPHMHSSNCPIPCGQLSQDIP